MPFNSNQNEQDKRIYIFQREKQLTRINTYYRTSTTLQLANFKTSRGVFRTLLLQKAPQTFDGVHNTKLTKEGYIYDVHENYPIFKIYHPPCPSISKILPPP